MFKSIPNWPPVKTCDFNVAKKKTNFHQVVRLAVYYSRPLLHHTIVSIHCPRETQIIYTRRKEYLPCLSLLISLVQKDLYLGYSTISPVVMIPSITSIFSLRSIHAPSSLNYFFTVVRVSSPPHILQYQ